MDAKDMKRHYIVRFINTGLAGCEYVINEESASFMVADRTTLAAAQQQSSDATTIYVLDDNIKTRFDILYTAAMPLPLLWINNDAAASREIYFHEVIDVEGVSLSLRPEGSEWRSAPHEEREAKENIAADDAVVTVAVPPLKATRWLSVALPITLLIIAGAAGYWLMNSGDRRQINQVSQLLGGNMQQFDTFVGRNGAVYVLAREPISRSWAWQSLIKNDMANQFTVLSARAEEENIAREITARWPQLKFHGVRFDNPAIPEIILSLERTKNINTSELEKISAKLAALFVWPHRFKFSYSSDDSIAYAAEQGLLSIVPKFDKRNNAESVTFSLNGTLNDVELNAVKNFVNDFRNKWKGDYIQFDIRLEDNQLKGKSRMYGADNYVKINADQWYFPTKF